MNEWTVFLFCWFSVVSIVFYETSTATKMKKSKEQRKNEIKQRSFISTISFEWSEEEEGKFSLWIGQWPESIDFILYEIFMLTLHTTTAGLLATGETLAIRCLTESKPHPNSIRSCRFVCEWIRWNVTITPIQWNKLLFRINFLSSASYPSSLLRFPFSVLWWWWIRLRICTLEIGRWICKNEHETTSKA